MKPDRLKRKLRIRSKISGTKTRPRVAVFRSNKYLYLQAIDDEKKVTLAAASSLKDKNPAGKLAKALLDGKIKKIVFDRGGYQYHGQVKKIADELRKEGLEF
jgi:large subunit ribosomal protein L18